MQVAGDALALSDLGEIFDFFISLAQFAVDAVALGEKDVPRANQHWKNCHPKQLPKAVVQPEYFDSPSTRNEAQRDHRLPLRLQHEWGHGCRENKKRAGPSVEGKEYDAQQK